jgi:hypothetical protein
VPITQQPHVLNKDKILQLHQSISTARSQKEHQEPEEAHREQYKTTEIYQQAAQLDKPHRQEAYQQAETPLRSLKEDTINISQQIGPQQIETPQMQAENHKTPPKTPSPTPDRRSNNPQTPASINQQPQPQRTEIPGAFPEDMPLPPTPPNEVFGSDQGVETQQETQQAEHEQQVRDLTPKTIDTSQNDSASNDKTGASDDKVTR